MLHLMSALRGLVKPRSTHIDNIFFCFHYKFTVLFLLAFSILVASRQYFGEPIECEFDEYENGKLNNYCFVKATFVREQNTKDAEVGGKPTETVRYYGYYSWVFLTLFLQAVFFYVPHYLWKAWESGRVKALSHEIGCLTLDEDVVVKEAQRLSKYFFNNLHTHNGYFYKYFVCELLNMINIVGQIFFMNRFIGEGFQFYGIYILSMNHDDVEKLIGQLFPMKTICTYEKYSLTGRNDILEGICLLTHNPLNEKIYGFLWFWMHFVALMTLLSLLYRIATLSSSSYRLHILRLFSHIDDADMTQAAYKKLQIGDWFLLLLLEKNVNAQVFKALLLRLASYPDVSDW
ncbi:viral innexin-g1.1 [Ichnoviriform fugitivi]|uniref:Viral innexin-g1.1 n=1 Tax=Ichnoviriform fugitivi TaxID=265522 RepID=A2Q0P4_9VIRU|nr:viral innexin-g1.1 [Ichnoviriform fugitivi]BAF45759.1 viral innexin-g1.1 [Ichnoviriform fugitivi]